MWSLSFRNTWIEAVIQSFADNGTSRTSDTGGSADHENSSVITNSWLLWLSV